MNNECDQERIIAAVDGELTAVEMARFEQHLKTCDSCRSEFEEYRNVASLCNALPTVDVPEGFAEEVLRGYEQSQVLEMEKQALRQWRSNPSPWKRWGSVAAAFAAILLVAVAVPMLRDRGPKDVVASILASADDPVSALDLVYSFSPEEVEVSAVEKGAISEGFLLMSNVQEGTVRISMASSDSVNLSDPARIVNIPIRLKKGHRRNKNYLRLESVRAYRPDGREVPATLEKISILSSDRPRSEASTTVSSV